MTQREKTIAACVGAVVLLYGLDQVLIEPYFEQLNNADDLIAQHQSDLETNNGVLRNRVAAGKQWKAVSGGRLKADASAAEGQLLARLQECARDAGMAITTLKPEKAEAEKGFNVIRLRATGTGTMRQITEFLFAIGNSADPVRVAELQLTTRKDGTDDLTMNVGLTTIYQSGGVSNAKVAAAYLPAGSME